MRYENVAERLQWRVGDRWDEDNPVLRLGGVLAVPGRARVAGRRRCRMYSLLWM